MTSQDKRPKGRKRCSSMCEEHIGIVGAPLIKGQGNVGANRGLREADLIDRLEDLGYDVTDHGDIEFDEFEEDPPQCNMKNPKAVAYGNSKIADTVSSVVSSGQTCVTLGGDRSVSIGAVAGHARVNPNLVLVWLDANANITPPLASTSGYIHEMPVTFLLKELEEKVPKIDCFNWLKPCLTAKDIVYIGLHDVRDVELYMVEKLGIRTFTKKDIDQHGIVQVVKEALEVVNPGLKRPIHLSFDMAGMDPVPALRTRELEHAGLTIREGICIVEELAHTDKLAAIDIVEINPDVDKEIEKVTTLHTCIEIVSSCFKNRRQNNEIPEKFEIPRPVMEKD